MPNPTPLPLAPDPVSPAAEQAAAKLTLIAEALALWTDAGLRDRGQAYNPKVRAKFYLRALADIPEALLQKALARASKNATGFPQPGEIRRAAEDIRNELRAAGRTTSTRNPNCPDCQGTGWRNIRVRYHGSLVDAAKACHCRPASPLTGRSDRALPGPPRGLTSLADLADPNPGRQSGAPARRAQHEPETSRRDFSAVPPSDNPQEAL